jgi:proline iminopeptidase
VRSNHENRDKKKNRHNTAHHTIKQQQKMAAAFHSAMAAVKARARSLYPEIEPFRTGMLAVSERHTVYWEQCGNPAGKPVVIVHGGPGGGCNPTMRRFHDPARYCITLFDQRGCGRSTPHADVTDNTTWRLVEDMERLRALVGVERWQVWGGSWGSTLALAYAETHPQRVAELVLRGIFMLRPFELRWFYESGGVNHIWPEAWQQYEDFIPAAERGDMIAAYHRRLFGDDAAVRLEAARRWSIWEGSTSFSVADGDALTRFGDEAFALAFARIENHYFVNRGFFETPEWLLDNAHKLSAIPTFIVHSRYDCVCPFRNAFELKQRMPHAELYVAPFSGHASTDPDVVSSLIYATDKFADADPVAAAAAAAANVSQPALGVAEEREECLK